MSKPPMNSLGRKPDDRYQTELIPRRIAAVVPVQTPEEIRRFGVAPTGLPDDPHGAFAGHYAHSNATPLTCTYAFALARSWNRANNGHAPALVEIDIDALPLGNFRTCLTMIQQCLVIETTMNHHQQRVIGHRYVERGDPHSCLEAFGLIWYQGRIPASSVKRVVAFDNLDAEVFNTIPEMVTSVHSFRMVRPSIAPLHNWLLDAARPPLPAAKLVEKSMMDDEGSWMRGTIERQIRERVHAHP